MEPTRGALIYEGKAKQVYATDHPDQVILHFKDEATAFNGVKRADVLDKGRINCAVTVHLLEALKGSGVTSHLLRQLDERSILCRRVEIIPVEVVVRNVIAGSLASRYGREEGEALPWPLVEYFVKSDALNDPLIGDEAAVALGLARRWELAYLHEQALMVNQRLRAFWSELGIDLIDFKLEFGRIDGRIVLADEITPDGSRLWEKGTRKRFDKDVFRRDLGDLSTTYRELYARVFGQALEA